MLEAIILVVFPFCMLFAAVSDMLSMTIANRVPAILAVVFILVAPMTGMEWSTIGWHLAGGGLVLLVTFTLFAVGGMGGGDAKLLAATALWMGFDFTLFTYMIYAALIGGILTISILLFRSSGLSILSGDNRFLRNFGDHSKGVPYGIALGLAGLMVYPQTALMSWALERLAAG